ncbi:MAG TPA: peptidoglycan DD-metalloendopeptidase family protein [Solimonas sp.]
MEAAVVRHFGVAARSSVVIAVCCAALVLGGCAGWSSWEDGKSGGLRPVESRGSSTSPAPPAPRVAAGDEYVVVRGDTMYSIAFRNNLDFRELAAWNGVGNSYLIVPGQVLRLTAPPKTRHQTGDIESEGMSDIQIAAPRPIEGDSPPPASVPPPTPTVAATGRPVPPPPADPALKSSYQWSWPTDGTVLRGFGQQGNKGLDFGGRDGQPVLAAAPGRVVYSGNALKGYGELIIIKHDDTYLSAYGYNRSRHVKEGDVVTAGQPIGKMGRGPENKPVLHFEIRERGKPINPASKLPPRAVPAPG